MKKEGSLKSILAILVIILLCLISFGGIYVKNKNVMKNILPDYNLGMDLDTNTIFKLEVVKDEENTSEQQDEVSSDEETNTEENETESDEDANTEQNETESDEDANTEQNETESDENSSEEENEPQQDTSENGQAENKYTLENYKKAKETIEKRLNLSNVQQYTVRLNEQTGSIFIEVPGDLDTAVVRNIFATGKIEIKINETDELIGDNNSIKKVETGIDDTYASYFGSVATINIEFSSDAVKKFKELKKNYVIPTDEEGKQTENTIQIYIDGSSMLGSDGMEETEFLDSAINGALPLSIGSYTTDEKELNEALEVANLRKAIMETENLPIDYTAEYGNEIHSDINKVGIISVFGVILVVMFIYLVFKYKLKGILAELSILGFGALLLLVLRYTKVQISIATLVSIASILILQFIYLIKLLNNKITPKSFTTTTIEYTKILIPAFIMSVVIAFANIIEISGFGMVIFWGIILFEIFNNIITKAILTNVKNK